MESVFCQNLFSLLTFFFEKKVRETAFFCFTFLSLGKKSKLIQFAVFDRHEFFGEEFAAVFFDDTAAFPTQTVAVTGEEGIDLVGHVGLEFVFGSGFDPGRFSFLNTETVDGTVEHVISPALVNTPLGVFFGDIASVNTGFDEFKGVFVSAQTEFNESHLFFGEFTEVNGDTDR